MKDLFITDKIDLTILLPLSKQNSHNTILNKVGGFYSATIKDGYITVKNVSLLDVNFVVTLVNGVE